jgi:hypothetical protein
VITLAAQDARVDALLDRVVTEGKLADLLETIDDGTARREMRPEAFEYLLERLDAMRVRWRMDADTCRN